MNFIKEPTSKQSIKEKKADKLNYHGEPFVWLTSLGLIVGLIMIIGLMYVVTTNGLSVFWPKRVLELNLVETSKSKVMNTTVLAGELVKKQSKKMLDPNDPRESVTEWQLFVANRNFYGYSYRYVDEDDIHSINKPKGLVSIERLEYGDLIAYPNKLALSNNQEILSSDPNFNKELNKKINEYKKRRQQINVIERKKIGKINSAMTALKNKLKAIESKEGDSEKISNIEIKMNQLQSDYEVLAKQARLLRDDQTKEKLIFNLPTGSEHSIEFGQIVHAYFPNDMNIFSRVKLFLINIWNFISQEPREANTEGGIFPAIFGTFVMTLMMSVAVTPFGVLAAIYLREYAKQGLLVRTVRIAVNNLAGVPSIVFGVFGLGFFVYVVGARIDEWFFSSTLPTPTFGTGGILWASLTLALMTVPVVIVSTEEALSAVPRGAREGSLACGASKWQTIQRVVLPASAPGIMTGFILAMARGAGEVAPLMLVGVVKLAPTLPLDTTFPYFHLERKFMHLGFHIYDLGFQSPDSEAAKPMVFATTLVLILLVVALNLVAISIRQKLKKKYAVSAV